ncbi:phosphotransferase family enzyme [Actinoplanes lutulentus]|uniref:Phosphotransferase family enzyme n=2 Tax=Actinoplanes lutulentus TaxID=1287878 RepID=A0A327ZAI1_9ACTN|nr:phosphotransferase family enzyme [Actinoplanes lutulentus]
MILGGGRLTPGVVKIGETVRRPKSAFTRTLLRHLAQAGFDGAPKYLGRDELDRDILAFLPGDVPAKWRALTDDQVAAGGSLLRRFHEASRALAERLGDGPVICHNDAGPNNTVFRHARPIAFIDFDFAAVGDPLEDVAYMAWSWCISSKPARGDAASQALQVRVLADAYELSTAQRTRLMDAVHERLVRNERFWTSRASNGPPVISGPPPAEVLAWTSTEKDFVIRFHRIFTAALA